MSPCISLKTALEKESPDLHRIPPWAHLAPLDPASLPVLSRYCVALEGSTIGTKPLCVHGLPFLVGQNKEPETNDDLLPTVMVQKVY